MNRDESHGIAKQGVNNAMTNLVYRSKLFREAQHVKYVLFQCGGFVIPKFLGQAREALRKTNTPEKLALLHLSAPYKEAAPWDQGLPPA